MEQIAISKFKATCLAVLEEVRRSGQAVLVTRRGEPIVEIIPPSAPTAGQRQLGALASTVHITGDVVAPVADLDEWEASR